MIYVCVRKFDVMGIRTAMEKHPFYKFFDILLVFFVLWAFIVLSYLYFYIFQYL